MSEALTTSGKSLIMSEKSTGDITEPWGVPRSSVEAPDPVVSQMWELYKYRSYNIISV